MPAPVSGQADPPTSSTPPEPATPPAPSGPPAGYVQLSEAEHNRDQAALRKLRREQDQREAADSERQRQEQEARGQYDAALETERQQRVAAQARLRDLAVQGAVRDAVMAEGLSGEKAAALTRLVPTSSLTVGEDGTVDLAAAREAVQSTRSQYASLFGEQSATPPADPATPPAAPQRPQPPATPPPPSGDAGLVTMEEYLETPQHIRMTPEFQERVKRSEHTWPKEVPASSFAQGV